MKGIKFVLVGVTFLSFAFSLKGQTEEGGILIGANTNLNFSYMNSNWKSDNGDGDMGSTINLEVSPKVGYFVLDGMAVGLEVPISYSMQENANEDKYTTTSFAGTPFLRYYFGSTNVKPYLHGQVGYGMAKIHYDPAYGFSDDFSANMFLYEVGGGVGFFINETICIDLGIGYASVAIKSKEDNENNYRTITSGLQMAIGIAVVL